jgi:pSer/pThr/pTyr-binding forkhead associated (FHA) protein
VSAYWLKYRGTRFPLRRGETVIGRSPYCSIVLSNARASRQHCAITWADDGLSLSDLGSSNGTTLNGAPVEGRHSLHPGDVLGVGTDHLELIRTERRVARGDTRTEQSTNSESVSDEVEERTNTRRQHATLELIEALAASATEANCPSKVTQSIMQTVDSFLKLLSTTGKALTGPDATRLAAVAEIIAARDTGRETVLWRTRTLERIKAHFGAAD